MSLFDSASLVVTPNGYKEDKLYSIKPTDGSGDLVVTRATTATRVNSDGLIEVTPYNLLQRSEQFDNAAWTKSNATITSNAIAAPDGTLTADKLVGSATTSTHIAFQTVSFPVNTVATCSIYAKAGELNFLYLGGLGRTPSANEGYVFFNLSSGTVGVNDTGYSGTISSAGDGWYKLTVSAPLTTSSLSREFRIGVTNTNGVQSYTGNGIDGVYIWGAQLVTGTSAKEYFPTTDRLDVPRLDYTNSSCPSILVEPQRTNLFTYSNDFSNGNWQKDPGIVVTTNATISPDGTQNACLMDYQANSISMYRNILTVGTTYTMSFYVKSFAGFEGDKIGIRIGGYGALEVTLTNSWQRVSITHEAIRMDIEIYNRVEFQPVKFYLYGAQLEAGSYATSYVPTVASSVTRNADVISKTGISSLIGQIEGTLFVDVNYKAESVSKNYLNLGTSTSNYIAIGARNNNKIGMEVLNSGVQVNAASTSTYSTSQRLKIAMTYKLNDFKLYVNGILQATDTSGTVPAKAEFYLGSYGNGTLQATDGINSAILWKTALTDQECIDLTTL